MKYLYIHPNLVTVEGKEDSALYDILHNKIFELNPIQSQIVKHSRNGLDLEAITGLLDGNETNDNINELLKMEIGTVYESNFPYFNETFKTYDMVNNLSFYSRPHYLTRLFIELNNSCEHECFYCHNNNMIRTLGCYGCYVWSGEKKKMDVTTVKSLFKNAIQLGFQQIILTGGNLLKEWSTVKQLAPFFKDIEVYTIVNLLMLNEDVINEINNIDNLNCIINIPILEEQLDVTSLYKIMALIQQYKRNTIKYGFQINAMYHKNINAVHSLITNCRLSSNDYYVEFVGEKVNHELRNYLTEAKLSYPDYQTFYYKKQYNYCMNGSLVIGYVG